MTASPIDQAVLWGQVYEIAVKRGVIAQLIHRGLADAEHPGLAAWMSIKTSKVYGAVKRELDLVDDNAMAQADRMTSHLLTLGYAMGWTCAREYLQRFSDKTRQRLSVRALWCPLSLPSVKRDREAEAHDAARQFQDAFGIEVPASELTRKGYPGWSDFTLWLTTPTKEPDQLLVLEFSFNAPGDVPDFAQEEAHLEELTRYARYLDARGVFSRVCAEVKGERFELSSMLASHLGSFTSRDKPFYKLCQGASYADKTVALLQRLGASNRPVDARVVAVTPNGFESLMARYSPAEPEEPRSQLMRQLGTAYRQAIKAPDDESGERLRDELAMVFNQLCNALPGHLRKQVREMAEPPAPGQELGFTFSEDIEGFLNPTAAFTREEALEQVNDSPAIDAYLGKPARTAIAQALDAQMRDGKVQLRGLHAAAVVAGLKAGRPGQVNVLALEGNPGIGKTTAVRRYLMEGATEGFLFLYVSPRVVINKDVTEKFARDAGKPTGILTVTTNAVIIQAASTGYEEMVVKNGGAPRLIRAVTVADGLDGGVLPEDCSTWFVTPEQENELETMVASVRLRKESLSEREDLVRERNLPGVLRTLTDSTARLLKANPQVNRVVMTAAMQGYRPTGTGSTIDGLSALFDNLKASSRAGLARRAEFARRIPNIIVMVDELAGDGAGAPFVHELARWLDEELIEPFENAPGGSPFNVALVVADASLGNEVVFESYLTSGATAPDKVLVSRSTGDRPFSLAATRVPIGGAQRDVLHVMTNSFPATTLKLQYHIHMHALAPEVRDDGTAKTVRERIRSQQADLLLASAHKEIVQAVRAGAQQVIYFAQDKEFLRDLSRALVAPDDDGSPALLAEDEVAILDSSVPANRRKRLVQEVERDAKEVFLMTSSGARGVSFPKATTIIACVPRFNIESSLMEVAQLIYRGRGDFHDPATGRPTSGDRLARTLVMVVDDFLPEEELEDDPRLWLRRASDLLTLVMMLRASVLTRVKGDADLPRRSLALVPVGGVGTTELLSTMSQALGLFRKEARVFLREKHPEKLQGLISNASANVEALFGSFKLVGLAAGPDHFSVATPRDMDAFVYAVTQEASPLALAPDGALNLPETVSCVGPFWMEDWGALQKTESFVFDRYTDAIDLAQRELCGQLFAITKGAFPPQLRRPANDLFRILTREKEQAMREFSTLKALASKAAWLAVPLDYPSFWRKADPESGLRRGIREEADWRDALARALQSTADVLPVVPRYEEFPYAVALGVEDPARLRYVFDDRYFMASTELNLLNTLLLADEERANPDDTVGVTVGADTHGEDAAA